MFGSDYWMNTLDPDHTAALSRFGAGVESGFGTRARQDFEGANALRWLGLTRERTDGDDEIDLGSPSYRRLVAFYSEQPLPEWLRS